jgi:hypothetical protein
LKSQRISKDVSKERNVSSTAQDIMQYLQKSPMRPEIKKTENI